MIPTSHAMIGYLAASKRPRHDKIFAALGALVPDVLSLIAIGVVLFSTLASGDFVYELYHQNVHSVWFEAIITPVLHSIFFWILLDGALYVLNKRISFFVIGGLTHIVADFLTHQGEYTWNHLYPLSVAPVEGIINYWDIRFVITTHVLWLGIILYWYGKRKKQSTAAV